MLTILLPSLALAAKPARPVVADHTAQALSFGEFMIGTSGVHVGVIPRIQIGTRPWVFAVGLPNLSGRAQIIDTSLLDLSVDASWLGSGLDGLSLTGVGGSVQSSVHLGRLSGHLGLRTYRFRMQGLPTAAPRWITGLVGSDPLADLSSMAQEAGMITAATVNTTSLRAAVEARMIGKTSLLLQSSMAMAGSAQFQAEASFDEHTIDIGPGLPGARAIDEATRPGGSWVLSLSVQTQLGPIHLRGGYGFSKLPYAWVPQAVAAHVRGGGFKKRRAEPVAESPSEPTDTDAAALVMDDDAGQATLR